MTSDIDHRDDIDRRLSPLRYRASGEHRPAPIIVISSRHRYEEIAADRRQPVSGVVIDDRY